MTTATKELARVSVEAAHEYTAKKMGWTSRQVLEGVARSASGDASEKEMVATGLFFAYLRAASSHIESGRAYETLRLAA